MTTYNGDFHREADVWVGEVREVPQAYTYGWTLARARDHLLEALALVHEAKMSRRDAAAALGLSYQRIDQLVQGNTGRTAKAAKVGRRR